MKILKILKLRHQLRIVSFFEIEKLQFYKEFWAQLKLNKPPLFKRTRIQKSSNGYHNVIDLTGTPKEPSD